MKHLIGADSPTGRGLVQIGDKLYVLSPCCGGTYEGSLCGKCRKQDTGVLGWDTCLPLIDNWRGTEPEAWRRWGLGIFGYENFAMKVEE